MTAPARVRPIPKLPRRAMIMAAGIGQRMRPLTNDRPKPLVEVNGKALIDHALDRMAASGVEEVVVNVHYLADRLEAHLAERTVPRIIISDERDALLDTGGGVARGSALLPWRTLPYAKQRLHVDGWGQAGPRNPG